MTKFQSGPSRFGAADKAARSGSLWRPGGFRSFTSLAARLIVSGAFVIGQPVLADPALQTAPAALAVKSASGMNGYTSLMAYLQTRDAQGLASAAGEATASSSAADYQLLQRFVAEADEAPASVSRQAPDDAMHKGLAAGGAGDAYAVLDNFVAGTDAQGAAPDDAVHSGLHKGGALTAADAKGDAYSVLTDFVKLADASGANGAAPNDTTHAAFHAATAQADAAIADAPIVVAAADAKPAKVKTPAPDAAAGAEPATYIGSEACVRCHRDQVGTFGQTLHGDILIKHPRNAAEKQGCESCHGPGSVHAKTKETDGGQPGDIISFRKDSPRSVEERNTICLSCHEKGDRTNWSGSAHETRGLACTNCHQLMEKVSVKFQLAKSTEMETCFQCHKDRRAQSARSSHMPVASGDMTCSSCHNPHGSATDKLLREASVNETCYKCHADKRGPFLWEHEPVRDSCLNCHEPHGTVNEYMLKVQRPRLCQLCHMGPGHGNPGNPMTVQAVNRSCQNCHTLVHGSNSPAGSLFQR